jgi:cytoskeletal protein CcmA (bactofilin family)
MFSQPGKKIIDNQKIDTIIGTSSNIQGTINSSGTVRIDGIYTGNVTSEADVIVGESGSIEGNIFASNVIISGKVNGNVSCKGLLEISSTGRLIGDVEVKNIAIADGAVFKGKCNTMVNETILTPEF